MLSSIQVECMEFIREYVSNNSLGLGSLGDTEFLTAMNAITKAMTAAWVDGYHCKLR